MMLPRLVMVFIFLLTEWFQQAYASWLWPVLGFFFMPYTTLAWMAAMLNTGGTFSAGWVVLIVLAVLADVSHWGGSYHGRARLHVHGRRKRV